MNSKKAIVASGHPLVSQAALDIIEMGGNAYDAVVGAGFVGAIAEPALTSLGGGGFIMAHTQKGDNILFDFFSDTPGKGLPQKELDPHFFPITVNFPGCDQIFNIGMGSVAVPGNLKGYLHVHQRLGRIPLSEIVKPAIKAARYGVSLNFHQASFLHLLKPIMTSTAEGRAMYSPQGEYLKEGDILFNLDLADFLENMPKEGWDSFYSGDIAQRIANDMHKGQGLLTEKDLNTYEVKERTPLCIDYRGYKFITNPPPSFGGSLITIGLQILERLPFEKYSWGTSEHMISLASVLLEVENLREKYGFSTQHLENSWLEELGKSIRTFSRGTTHVSIIDPEGNAASMTTSNGEGSGYIVPGTGIMLNNMMGEDDLHPEGFHASPPGQKIASMMSPSILLNNDEVALVIGSGGSKRIRSAITQVISNIIDFELPIKKAVEAPRIHWDNDILQTEPGISSETLAIFQKHWQINEWQEKNIYFGGVHALIPDKEGAGDSRRGGNSRKTG